MVLSLQILLFTTLAGFFGSVIGQLPIPSDAKYDYNDALSKSILFYETQRSGRLPENNRVPWRGNSQYNDQDNGRDLNGGYYVAEGAIKMTYGISLSTTLISWGVLAYGEGYKAAGELQNVLNSLRWANSFLLKAVPKNQDDFVIYAQIGSQLAESTSWVGPEKVNADANYATELLAETSAAFSASAIVFRKENDANRANQLIELAKKLFQLAITKPKASQSSITQELTDRYGIDDDFNDDLAWAATWLYRATQVNSYYNYAMRYYNQATSKFGRLTEFSWKSKLPGVQLLLEITDEKGTLLHDLTRFCDDMVTDNTLKTPKGFLHPGPLPSTMIAGNAAFICHHATDLGALASTARATKYREFARKQIHYMLGDSGRSYLIGFGHNYPEHAYHKGSSCPAPPARCGFAYRQSPYANKQVLNGGLVAGPDTSDKYYDIRNNVNSRIGIEFNAGFQSALAGLRFRETKGDYISKKTAANTDASYKFKHDYGKVLHLSMLFYEAQRAGELPSTNRIPWRSSAALTDKGTNGEDLSGGYFDGSGYVKFGFPLAFSLTMLSWGGIEYRKAYVKAGELQNLYQTVRWGTDYLIKCHQSSNEFYAQVGKSDIDEAYWGRAEDMNMKRPAFKLTQQKPGTEIVSEAAAALSAAAILFQGVDSSYSTNLIKHARELYSFASGQEGYSKHSVPDAMNEYATDSGYQDELAWAAAWLYRATNNAGYLAMSENRYQTNSMGDLPLTFYYDDKRAGIQVLLANLTGRNSYKVAAATFCDSVQPGQKVSYTPKGLLFLSDKSSNKHASNVAFICLLTSHLHGLEEGRQKKYQLFAANQIGYMLGDKGQGYLVGYGSNYPRRPYHKGSSCPLRPAVCDITMLNRDGPNPQVLYGALVAGPSIRDNYKDVRTNTQRNSVSLDTNAGFQSAAAGLLALQTPDALGGGGAGGAQNNRVNLNSLVLLFLSATIVSL